MLAELYEEKRAEDLFTLGVIINQAVGAPKELSKIWRPPTPKVEVSGMLKPVRKKKSDG